MAEEGREIDRAEARNLVRDGAQLVGVGGRHEREHGRGGGAAPPPLAVPEPPQRAGEIDRERPVILYCRGGNRSTMAAAALAEAGYDAMKLEKGIVGWVEEGFPVEPEDAYVAQA